MLSLKIERGTVYRPIRTQTQRNVLVISGWGQRTNCLPKRKCHVQLAQLTSLNFDAKCKWLSSSWQLAQQHVKLWFAVSVETPWAPGVPLGRIYTNFFERLQSEPDEKSWQMEFKASKVIGSQKLDNVQSPFCFLWTY